MEKAQDPCGGQFIRWRHDAHSESAEKFVVFGGVLSVLCRIWINEFRVVSHCCVRDSCLLHSSFQSKTMFVSERSFSCLFARRQLDISTCTRRERELRTIIIVRPRGHQKQKSDDHAMSMIKQHFKFKSNWNETCGSYYEFVVFGSRLAASLVAIVAMVIAARAT